tara:strand:+ start:61 stop:420 length:360 start_codon:yes stop_codon:yes gene_type:complete
MASTRNKNTSLNYNLENQNYKYIVDSNLYLHSSSGRPISECIPNVGYTPSHMSRDTFSNNAIDIESSLYGIGSTNLVKPCAPVVPSMRSIDFKDYFERTNTVIMPYPLVFENNQRPHLS